MKIGVAYYPEHWPEDRWSVDAGLMKQAGIDSVRLGEFAWSRLEPKRGQYDMGWLERAIDVFAGEGIRVILCTPTTAPPAWLFHRHPSMAARDRQDLEWHVGSQGSACLNNRPYRRYVRRILREVARRFARNNNILAWQIDNEIGVRGGGPCYCDDCEQAFREWLRRRYGTIERLNKLWGTVFWGQEFADWHLVPAPRRTPGGPHPSLALDYRRFMSATVRDFVDEQKKLVSEYARKPVTVTTNVSGQGAMELDLFSLAATEDVVAIDNPGCESGALTRGALNLDLARSTKKDSFWVLKQRAGACRIGNRRRQNLPGQLRLWAFQAAARGASFLNFYRWRCAPFGQEMNSHGLLAADGSETRGFAEVRDTIMELRRYGPAWEGRLPAARVALVLDYHAMWALRLGQGTPTGLSMQSNLTQFHAILLAAGQPVDVVAPRQDLEGYDVVIAPAALISRDQVAGQWQNYVDGGGVLLATGPVGLRTEYNTASLPVPPGHFADVFGARIAEHDVVGESGSAIVWGDETYPARAFMGLLKPYDADVEATWQDDLYGGEPALTVRRQGAGSAWLLAGHSDERLYSALVHRILDEAELKRSPWASDTVEVIPLQSSESQRPLTFVLNHGEEAVDLVLPRGEKQTDILSGVLHKGTVPLPGFGVVLLQG